MPPFYDLQFSPTMERLIGHARAEILDYPNHQTGGLPDVDQAILANDLVGFQKVLRQALSFLRSPATFDLAPGMGPSLAPVFNLLDNAVILEKYLIDRASLMGDKAVMQVLAIGEMATTKQAVPFHRFIPVNAWRRQFRDHLPEDVSCFFPWYDFWANEDELLLEEFVYLLPILQQGDFSSFASQDAPRLRRLFAEIQRDKPFIAHLNKRHLLLQKTVQAVGKNTALRLFFLADGCEPGVYLPELVLEKGLHTVAVAAMAQAPTSEEKRHELLFLAAFAGPELEDEERLAIFRKTVAFIGGAHALQEGGLMDKLRQWAKNTLDDQELSTSVYRRWRDLLNGTAPDIVTPFAYQDGQFSQVVGNLHTASVLEEKTVVPASDVQPGLWASLAAPAKKFWDNFTEIIGQFRESLVLEPELSRAMSEEGGARERKPVEIPGLRLRQELMPEDGQFLTTESAREIRELLGDKILYFITLAVDSATGQISATPPARLTRSSRIKDDIHGKPFVVGIGADKEGLEAAIDELTSPEGIRDQSKLDHILWIAITINDQILRDRHAP